MRLAVLFLVALGACGSVTSADDDAGALEAGAGGRARDAGHELEARDAAVECPPIVLSCSNERNACPQGMATARRSDCGGAPYTLCCPVADCELAACEPCPGCP